MEFPQESIADLCRDLLIDQKWLLAPSLAIGTQWVDYVARQGVACINLQVATCDTLACEWAHTVLAEGGLTVLPPEIDTLLLRAAWEELPADGYLRRLEPSPGVLRSLQQTIQDLRLHEISPDQLLQTGGDGSPQRLQELGSLLQIRSRQLQEYSLADRADVLRIAIDVLSRQTAVPGWLLIPDSMEAAGLEQKFLQQFGSARRYVGAPLAVQAAGDATAGDAATGRTAHQTANRAANRAAHQTAVPSTVRRRSFFRAIGPVNELRGVLRRCAERGDPLDCVEVLTTDVSQTAELLLDLLPEVEGRDPLSQVTLADGLPIARSRPAMALLGLLRWAERDYAVREFCTLLENDLLDCGTEWGVPLARVLKRLGIKAGNKHYIPRLQREVDRLTEQQQSCAEQIHTDGAAAAEEVRRRAATTERRLARLQSLLQLCAGILPLVEQLHVRRPQSMQAVQTLLDRFAVVRDSIDAAAKASLENAIARQQQWQQTLQLEVSPGQWLRAFLLQANILQSGPQPGCLHVASVHRGGQTGRRYCFVTGLNDQRIPGGVRQDPALSDDERKRLGQDLPTGASRHHSRLRSFQHMIEQQPGEVTLSWSCLNPDDGSEMFPSRIVHDLARQSAGVAAPSWDTQSLDKLAGAPVGWLGDNPQHACSDGEADLPLLLAAQPGLLEARFPWLAPADREASSNRLDGFHGDVSASRSCRPVIDQVNHAWSASALETLGRCPLAYFFSRCLRGFQEEEFDDDLDRWLDPATFGRLVHEVFQQFLGALSPGERPEFDRHWPELKSLVVKLGQQYERDVPPATRSGYRQDLARVVRIARTFLREESVWYRNTSAVPRYFEATLGMSSQGAASTPLDTDAGVPVVLPSGRRIFGRGQVDRIDEFGPGRYSICDYKTGSAFGYSAADPFAGGRRLQSTFYLKMVQSVLREKVAAESAVVRFEYFFPGLRGDGLRLGWDAIRLEPGLAVIETLVQLDEDGLYPPTNNPDDCRFCAYRRVCGDVQRQARLADQWYDTDERLADLKEVRDGQAR